jgi:AGZA family xanthine/uracil permease-like MFS transporter
MENVKLQMQRGSRFFISLFTWNDLLGFLMLFGNDIAVFMIAAVLLLQTTGGAFTADDVYGRMFPAIGLLIFCGGLYFAVEARRRTVEGDRVTALPFGLNLPDVINFATMMNAVAAGVGTDAAWKVGCAANFFSSLLLLAVGLGMLIHRRVTHAAAKERNIQALLEKVLPAVSQAATLAGIALALISSYNFVGAFAAPLLALPALVAILVIGLLVKRLEYGKAGAIPTLRQRSWVLRFPGLLVLGAVVLASAIANVLQAAGMQGLGLHDAQRLPPVWRFGVPQPQWFLNGTDLLLVFSYIGTWFPLAIASLVGTMNNVVTTLPRHSKPDMVQTLTVSGGLSLASAFLGCPFPCTVYIGQPTFFAAGAGAGYSLINGVVMLVLTWLSLMPYVAYVVPELAVSPILVLIGLDIFGEAFRLAVSESRRPDLGDRTNTVHRHPAPVEPGVADDDTALLEQEASTPEIIATSDEVPVPREPDDLRPRNNGSSGAALFPAVVIGLLPALASFAWQQAESVALRNGIGLEVVVGQLRPLAALQQGYILTSMLWSAAFYFIIVALEPIISRKTRRLEPDANAALKAGLLFGVLAVLSFLGVLHTVSVTAYNALTPAFAGSEGWFPYGLYYGAGYSVCAILVIGLHIVLSRWQRRI